MLYVPVELNVSLSIYSSVLENVLFLFNVNVTLMPGQSAAGKVPL